MTSSSAIERNLDANKKLYTLEDERGQRIVFSLEQGLILESWHLQDASIISHPGSIIGPHAGSRSYLNQQELFIDGVGASMPWECISHDSTQLIAQLQGTMKWKEQTLALLEGQAFFLEAQICLKQGELLCQLAVRAESDGLIGLRCPLIGKAPPQLQSKTATDAEFLLEGMHPMRIKMHCQNAEASWRIEPLSKDAPEKGEQLIFFSARHPEKPILTINQITILFSILK